MAPQFLKSLALGATFVALGIGLGANAQPTPATNQSGGPVPSADKSGGPVPAKDKSGGPVPAKSNEGMPMQSKADARGAAKSSLSPDERKFVEKVAHAGAAEVELGKVAQQKGQSQAVKDFGQRMVQDHTKAGEELKALASNKGVQLPADADKAHKADTDKMGKLSGDRFDREYAEHMVKDHKEVVKDFEKQAKNAKDADVRAFASKTLPALQEHLKMAQAMEQQVKGGGKADAKADGKAGAKGK